MAVHRDVKRNVAEHHSCDSAVEQDVIGLYEARVAADETMHAKGPDVAVTGHSRPSARQLDRVVG